MTHAVVTIDFETEAVAPRPEYPPEPVGCAIKYGSEPSRYYAWGHPIGNNCTKEAGVREVRRAFARPEPKLFHHAKFDLAVAYEKLGVPELRWDEVHDTTLLAYLHDPHNRDNGLKELAHSVLGWAPDERDEVAEWIWEHRAALVEEFGGKITRAKKGDSSTGAWIGRAPGDIVGRYACGDTDRTYALFEHYMPKIAAAGMRRAYDRERQILPIFMENERIGMRVAVEVLGDDVRRYAPMKDIADDWLRKRLGQPELNVDSPDEFAEALSRAGVVDDDRWTLTATGKRSVAKNALRPDMYNDPEVASAYGYRQRLATCLDMFMTPWLAQAERRGGYISTNWNQTYGENGGTRTGRPSTSNPNFLNITKNFEDRDDGYSHPAHIGVAPLPLVRRYVLPDEDSLFLHRDFDGQELRIYAHIERGDLYRRYLANPRMKPHDYIKGRVEELTGEPFSKTVIKNINFGKIYGAGLPRIAELLRSDISAARRFNDIHNRAMPDLEIVKQEIKAIALSGEPIRTWGGRLYYPETPRRVDGKMRDFIYKLLNYEVQGSAADCTKEALIRWRNHPDRDPTDRFLVTVYDEINISGRKERWREAMRCLKEAMESIEIGVPMLSSPKAGPSWGDAKEIEE